MNPLLQSLATEEWADVVKALLHTLWLGGLAAGGLYMVLRGKVDPMTRYRWGVGALVAVVFGGIVAWAVLQRRPVVGHSASATNLIAVAPASSAASAPVPRDSVRPAPAPMDAAEDGTWTTWLAVVWLGGVAAMLARAGSLVAGAEKLRRQSRPLENETVLKLIEEARGKLRLARRIQVVVTEQLSSPAVMGLVTPVLILPLSLVTTLPMDQLQLIFLHELAHIRRGDYLVNLCQLLAEALLFFNPAVWWISRQIRQEREACCDAVALALAGEPLQYARTLAQVAGKALAAAPAFGDRRNPTGLKDRIQRLLVPGYRPSLRLTWRALLMALIVGGGVLFLSALGANVAVAAILSPQERIARIEKKMTEMGENPEAASPNGGHVTVSGQVVMADWTPVPRSVSLDLTSLTGNSSVGTFLTPRNGAFTLSLPAGNIYIRGELTNCAPVGIGPLDGIATNQLANLVLVFNPGFDATIALVDAESGKPVAGGKLSAQFWMRGLGQTSFRERALTTDEKGLVLLAHAADLPLVVTVNAPGYEILEQRFESVQSNKTLRIAVRPGARVSGVVLDNTSGEPIAGATVRVRYEKGPTEKFYGWDDAKRILAKTDQNGRFVANQLRMGTVYWLGVSAAGHESIVLKSVFPDSVLEAKLGPEIVVKGRVTGNLDQLEAAWDRKGGKQIAYTFTDDHAGYDGRRTAVWIVDGIGYFQFTNELAGWVVMNAPGQPEERKVSGPVEDWRIALNNGQKIEAKDVPRREVVFRFKYPSGAPPRGSVSVQIPDNLEKGHLTAHNVEMKLTNGEARVEIALGGQTFIEPKNMVGYWFNSWTVGKDGAAWIIVTNGAGPMVVEIPLLPAGAIYAKARDADGTPANGLGFGLNELKRAPGVDKNTLFGFGGDHSASGAAGQWISGPLPLGGTYQIYGWRGNSFCLSKPVKLTEANPDTEIELQFPPGKTFDGVVLDPAGNPLRDAELKPGFELQAGHGFGLQSVFTDEHGGFRLENMNPEFGDYSVEAGAPGARFERVKLDFGSQPLTIRLKPGRTLAGWVVQAGTGYAIPNEEVRAVDYDHLNLLPMLLTQTDSDGRFEFKNLGEGNYSFYFKDGQSSTAKKYRADGNTNVVLPVKLFEWSQAKPNARQAR